MIKSTTLLALNLTGLMVIIFIVFGLIVLNVEEIGEKTRNECRAKGFECQYASMANQYEICYNNCNELSLNFYKYDASGLGSTECWCLKDNLPKQIW